MNVESTAFSGNGVRVYETPELLCEIATYVDWPTLMALGNGNRQGRDVARYEVRARIRFVVSPFIPSEKFDLFIDLLHRTGAGIVGSAARSVLTLNSDFVMDDLRSGEDAGDRERWIWPDDLNIAVRPRYWREWEEFFIGIGFDDFWHKRVAPWMRNTVHAVACSFGSAAVEGRVMDDIASVKLIVCKKTVIETALTSIFSTQANVITATTVHAFFQTLSLAKQCIRNSGFLPGYPVPSMWSFETSNEDMDFPCGWLCPARIRPPSLEEDSASFVWNAQYRPSTKPYDMPRRGRVTQLLQEFHHRCYNRLCENYQPTMIELWDIEWS